MNLVPAATPGRWKAARRPGSSVRTAALPGALLVGVSLSLIAWEVHALERRIDAARSERDRLAALAAERDGADERLAADRERLGRLLVAEGRLSRWDEERFVLPELLRELSAAVPDEVVLEEIRREGSNLRITGEGDSAATVAATAGIFSRLERVSDLELLWVEQVEGASGSIRQRFSLTGGLRYASRDPQPFGPFGAAGNTREPPS